MLRAPLHLHTFAPLPFYPPVFSYPQHYQQHQGHQQHQEEEEQSAVVMAEHSDWALHEEREDLSAEALDQAWQRTLQSLEQRETRDYVFAQQESLEGDEQLDAHQLFQLALRLFEDGHVYQAQLRFERLARETSVAAEECRAEVWRRLGLCHAEQDQDDQAISCFRRALEADPYHLDALLQLTVGQVNELQSQLALGSLRSWVSHHPRFSHLQLPEDDMYGDGSLLDEVLQLLLLIEQRCPEDAEVQTVLGVLYNATQHFAPAAAAFKKALRANDDDYSLLNKLGATLANQNQSIEALPLYQRALQRRPRYVRGWANLGISYSNLGMHTEACRAYLTCLHLNPHAHHLWGYLRLSLGALDRLDLASNENVSQLAAALGVQLGVE